MHYYCVLLFLSNWFMMFNLNTHNLHIHTGWRSRTAQQNGIDCVVLQVRLSDTIGAYCILGIMLQPAREMGLWGAPGIFASITEPLLFRLISISRKSSLAIFYMIFEQTERMKETTLCYCYLEFVRMRSPSAYFESLTKEFPFSFAFTNSFY